MPSRMERYGDLTEAQSARTKRNQDLYRNIYEEVEYTNIEGIASIGRTNEVDLSKIKEMLRSREEYKREKNYDIIKPEVVLSEPIKQEEYSERNYDIRDILSKAKTERTNDDRKRSLDDNKINLFKKINTERDYKNVEEIIAEENELKELMKTLTTTTMIKNMNDKDLSLNLLDDLKAGETTNISATNASIKALLESEKEEFEQDDETTKIDTSFFTSSLGFNESDFEDLKEANKTMKKTNTIMIVFLVLIFIVAVAVAVYFGFKFLK